jgi:hypothetical protein
MDRLQEGPGRQLDDEDWRKIDAWINDHSEQEKKFIHDNIRLTALTPLIKEYYSETQILKPYWDITNNILERMNLEAEHKRYKGLEQNEQAIYRRSPRNMRMKFALDQIQLQKEILRRRNVDIDAAYIKWFGGKPKHPMNVLKFYRNR